MNKEIDFKNKISGVVYCARGKPYLKQAELSAKSLQSFSPNIPCTIFTTEKITGSNWDKTISLPSNPPSRKLSMSDKLFTLIETPYSHTLYLDADTLIIDNISEMFQILHKFDLSICHGHDRQKRFDIQTGIGSYKGKTHKAIDITIPYAFSPLQGGLILFKKNNKVNTWLNDLYKLYIQKDYYDDQVSIRELLWKSNLNFYVLPPEYNFNTIDQLKSWKKYHYKQAKPKIFHYTQNKASDIEKLIYSVYNPNKNNWQDFQGRFNWIPMKVKLLLRRLIR